MSIYGNLETIISNTTSKPNIINENCNFVVITYWWGRNRKNANLARPCGIFYENFIAKIISKALGVLNSGYKQPYYDLMLKDIQNCNYSKIIESTCKDYLYELMIYLDLKPNCFPHSGIKDDAIKTKIAELKPMQKIEESYNFVSSNYIHAILQFVATTFINNNKDKLNVLAQQIYEMNLIKNEYSQNASMDKKQLLQNVKQKKSEYDALKAELKKQMSVKLTYQKPSIDLSSKDELFQQILSIYDDSSIQNKSLIEILVEKLRYKPAITYDQMITLWEQECSNVTCNYMAVEYPEFAAPGGYQLAINAKPMFIQKALELCHPRNVLYIDGDMYVRHYPHIFDLKDVDYMARGWNIDPRSSDMYMESILYDPYTFETSGGTMFFSQSTESKKLLSVWIDETKKPINNGKADDRIISLLFNTKKFLCNMKIIQLPIEYLWLSLFYDDTVGGVLYDYDESIVKDSIFIDHPECLTSEDTAASSGAANQRTPFIYDKFIADITDPISEEMYEYIFFKDKELVKSMKYYLDYMKSAYYFYDGNDELVQKNYVTPGGIKENNEQPLYIYDYDKKFNKKNEIHEKNMSSMGAVDLSKFQTNELGILEIKNVGFDELMSIFLKCIQEHKKCIYLSENMDVEYYNNFKTKYTMYKDLEFVYVPLMNSVDNKYNSFYKLAVDTKQPIYINADENSSLFKYVSMFSDMDELSDYMNNGCYFLISTCRIGYIFKSKKEALQLGGSDGDGDIDNYLEGLGDMYNTSSLSMAAPSGGKRRRKTRKYPIHKNNRKKTRKH